MDADFKRRWLRALQKPVSQGGYRKGTGTLVTDHDGFCCLGVAFNEMIKAGLVDGDWTTRPHDGQEMSKRNYLPGPVLDAIGLSDRQQHELANINDQAPRDRFAGAIKYIEENL